MSSKSSDREDYDQMENDYEEQLEKKYELELLDNIPTEEDLEAARADIEKAEKLHRVSTSRKFRSQLATVCEIFRYAYGSRGHRIMKFVITITVAIKSSCNQLFIVSYLFLLCQPFFMQFSAILLIVRLRCKSHCNR